MASPHTQAYASGGDLHMLLASALSEIAAMPAGEQRTWALRGIANLLMGAPEHFKTLASEQCPELALVEPIPDTHLDSEEEAAAARLTAEDLQTLECAVLGGATTSWRKVSRVIGDAMVTLQGQLTPLPLGIYARHIEALVQEGKLEAQGDVRFMHVGKVRLHATAAHSD